MLYKCMQKKIGYSVVRDFCGHGIGKIFHCAPNILHYGEKGQGMKLKEGMIFTIEPMINLGKKDIKILMMDGLLLQEIKNYQHNMNILLVLLKMVMKYLLYLKMKKII